MTNRENSPQRRFMATAFSSTPSFGSSSSRREGSIARAIEQQTAKIPSDVWLWAAFGAIGVSLFMQLRHRQTTASFVGHWVPTLLSLGIYNKLVKQHGSDAHDQEKTA
jgi:hypothetical protein